MAVHTPDKIQTMLQKFHGVILALVKFSKITIAEVHGGAWAAARNWRWSAICALPRRTPSGDFLKLRWDVIRLWRVRRWPR